ncbi:NUDIX hydrolase [Pontivivens insulae]|nr:NUDIX domain-containing protein [Pontivivens insulae]RED11053.1 hypothetical protein DFR53_3082 [Pontivivens insulae]
MTDPNDVPIRDAATIILLRGGRDDPHLLMGQRGAKAVFMPNKYVFPGGALDDQDRDIPVHRDLVPHVRAILNQQSEPDKSARLALAAIRELFEETGLALGQPGQTEQDVPPDWAGFVARGLLPDLGALDVIFRAVTPAGRPRRFDARFFMARVEDITGDPDDFSEACDELSHLHWVPLADARKLALPFITEIVLSEVEARLRTGPRPVPFFNHVGERSHFRMLTA